MDERSQLRVEGTDDDHTIRHLLIRHGVNYDRKPWPTWVPTVQPAGDKDKLLQSVERSVKAGSGRAVGFVVDADTSSRNRWQAVSSRLKGVGVDTPNNIPLDGFVGKSKTYLTRVGVWLMPDNRQHGTLEDFLETLVSEDALFLHAKTSTTQARQFHGAKYRHVDQIKAVLHAWLAWQVVPGLPYGTAIRARYFQHGSPVAESFVAWFRRVFELQ